MKNSRGNLSEVLRKREEVINRIREKMPSEADALEALDMAAAALDANANSSAMQAGEYTNTTRAIDALVAHLTKSRPPDEARPPGERSGKRGMGSRRSACIREAMGCDPVSMRRCPETPNNAIERWNDFLNPRSAAGEIGRP